jgi:hypothetical protein
MYLERVTGIEPALSAWESDRSGSLTALTWKSDVPLVTVMDPVTPGLMARQWPVVWVQRPLHDARSGVLHDVWVISRAAMHVSRVATAVAAARRRSMRSAQSRRS